MTMYVKKIDLSKSRKPIAHSSWALSIDCRQEAYIVTTTGNISSFTLTNRPTGQNIVYVAIDAINWGAYTITFTDWTTAFKWDNAILPNLTASGNDKILLTIWSSCVCATLVGKDILWA